MKLLNDKCEYVLRVYLYDSHIYAQDLREQMIKEAKEYQEEINKKINEQLLQESLSNPKENYYILLYIIYFEIHLTKELNETIALSLLKNMDNEINPILIILMSSLEISNKVVKYILTITTDEYIEENFNKLGEKPFDFRYHILKRKEISEELKNEVLKKYQVCYDFDEDDEATQLYYDILFEIESKNIKTKEELEKYKDLVDEIRCYKILKKMNKKF